MPRNGAGVFSLVNNTWFPPVNGVLATATDWTPFITDVQNALTQSVSSDGQTPMTGNLPMGNNKITGLAPGTANTDAINFTQQVGRLIGVQVIAATGTYTPTTGTSSVVVEAIGGGGGGGGTATTVAGQAASAGGGGAGTYGRGRYTSAFSGVTVTIGAAGATGAAGGSGGNGGTTSFGALLSCPGGSGGVAGAASTPPAFGTNVATGGGAPTGANIVGVRGADGGVGILLTTGQLISGKGADSIWGTGGGLRVNAGGAGNSATGFGSGGGGSVIGAGVSGLGGGASAPGLVIIYEYA